MKSVEAIILQNRPIGEADELLNVFSKEQGRLTLRARGVKKPKAKHRGALQELNWLEIWFVSGRGLPVVTDSIVKVSFPSLKSDPGRFYAARRISRLLAKALPEGDRDYPLWWMLTDYLSTLERAADRESTRWAPAVFVWKFLALHGTGPDLSRCVVCGRPPSAYSGAALSPSAGGPLCQDCLRVDPAATRLLESTRAMLGRWRTLSMREILEDDTASGRARAAAKTVENFARWHLGFPVELSLKVGL